MNYSADDVLRSLRRQASLVLTEPWRVRTERQPVTPDERPAAVVEAASALSTGRARTSVDQGPVEKMQAFSIMAYPQIADTARESRLEAYRIAQLLDDTFTHGLVEDRQAMLGEEAIIVSHNIGAPFHIPVYDFAGVPVTGRNRQGPADPYGYAWIAEGSLSVRPIQDTVDPLRFTVTADMRLTWEAAGRRSPDAPAVTSVPIIGRDVG